MTTTISGTTGVDAPDYKQNTLTTVMLGQIVTFSTGAVATGTTLIPYDDTVPQNTEGDQYLSLAITPQSTSSILEIHVSVSMSNSGGAAGIRSVIALFQDSTASALNTQVAFGSDINSRLLTLTHIMTAGTTSATTFKVRAGSNIAGTTTINGTGGARIYGGTNISSITIKEYLP
jgi:hypothetical protein